MICGFVSDFVVDSHEWLDGMSGSPKLTKVGTGNCWFLFRRVGLKAHFDL